MGGRGPFAVALLAAALVVVQGRPAIPAPIPAGPQRAEIEGTPIAFVHSRLTELVAPTSLQFGPDGRLYVATVDGMLRAFRIERAGPGDYAVVHTEEIPLLRQIPNHDDDGTPRPDLTTRMVTGILLDGTAEHPVLYATSSDPRVGDKGGHDLGIDTNSGTVSRLRWTGSAWTRQELVAGLPRSAEDHAPHGLQRHGSTLYVAQGGNTNQGAPSRSFLGVPEYELSAAVLAIDLEAIGEGTWDLRTRDDPTRADDGDHDQGDPFGGGRGANQAIVDPAGPVQLFATGYRNPYDLVHTTDGRLYLTDNGPNRTWGGAPSGCSDTLVEGGSTFPDTLHLVAEGSYGGHPNPTRGRTDERECRVSSAPDRAGVLAAFPSSTNGITEYTAATFGGAMQGDLLTVSFDGALRRLRRDVDGQLVGAGDVISQAMGAWPLDVTAQGDSDVFPGTIWVAVHLTERIQVFEPVE